MTLETFFEKFDLFADAPDAVAKMRELVLRTATQGKLVRQDLNEEPASELIRRAVQARKQLVAAGLVRDEVPDLGSLDQINTNLPSGWVLAPLSVYVGVIMGQSPPSSAYNESGAGLPFYQGKAQFGQLYPTATNWCTEPTKIGEPGDVVISVRAPVGPTNVLRERSCIGRGLAALRSLGGEQMHLLYTLRALERDIAALGVGSTFVAVSKYDLDTFQIPIPPLAEQRRIVAKVGELMALCDRLEAQQEERETRHAALARASLARFADAPTPANLDLLFRKSYTISPADLRKAILTLAVQGKLVPQDPNDELAETRLLPPVTRPKDEQETPFELPDSWRWIQLGQVSELINGDRSKNYPNKAEYVQEGVAWINTGHIEPDGTLSTDSMHYITREKFDSLRSGKVRPGDLVYCLRGATLGKTAIITQFEEGAVASSLVIIRLSAAVDPRFAYRFLTSPLGREQIFQFDNGSAQPNLSANSVKKYWLPLPPLAEQRQIVAKVDQLMALVDQVETQLAHSRATAEKLMEAVVAELTQGHVRENRGQAEFLCWP